MSVRKRPLVSGLGIFAVDFVQKFFLKKDVAIAERRGERLGELFYKIDRKHRKRTMANLRLAFPEWPEDKVVETSREVFRHFGRVTGDFFRSPLRSREELLEDTTIEGYEHYEKAVSIGKGVLIVTGHFGNFERFLHWLGAALQPITVVARDANQSGVQERIGRLRQAPDVAVVSRGSSMRGLLQKLRNNEMVGLTPDQNCKEAYLPFFGKPCGTVVGPAKLHVRTGAAMLPCFCVRTGPGKYHVFFHEPIDLENKEEDIEVLMTEFNRSLEQAIRRYPEQYLWLHDRWKSARQLGLL